MSEDFKVIETQEEFDEAISERLKREKDKYAKLEAQNEELKGQVNTLQGQLEELETGQGKYSEQIESLKSEINDYKQEKLKNTIAMEYGIPRELANRLVGEDEDALRSDARSLSDLVKNQRPTAPLKSTEPEVGDSEEAAYQALANNLFEGSN